MEVASVLLGGANVGPSLKLPPERPTWHLNLAGLEGGGWVSGAPAACPACLTHPLKNEEGEDETRRPPVPDVGASRTSHFTPPSRF